MILYYSPKSVSLASHLVLEETGAPYEARALDFNADEQRSADYLRVNPKGRVPALQTEHGILTETPAILAYLAQHYPAARLAPPAESFGFARAQEFNLYLAATVHVAHAHRVRGRRWTDDESALDTLKAKVPANMHECFQLIAEHYFVGPWVLGDQFSLCDPYLFTVASWLPGDGVDLDEFPALAEHSRRVAERDASQRVLPLHGL